MQTRWSRKVALILKIPRSQALEEIRCSAFSNVYDTCIDPSDAPWSVIIPKAKSFVKSIEKHFTCMRASIARKSAERDKYVRLSDLSIALPVNAGFRRGSRLLPEAMYRLYPSDRKENRKKYSRKSRCGIDGMFFALRSDSHFSFAFNEHRFGETVEFPFV